MWRISAAVRLPMITTEPDRRLGDSGPGSGWPQRSWSGSWLHLPGYMTCSRRFPVWSLEKATEVGVLHVRSTTTPFFASWWEILPTVANEHDELSTLREHRHPQPICNHCCCDVIIVCIIMYVYCVGFSIVRMPRLMALLPVAFIDHCFVRGRR